MDSEQPGSRPAWLDSIGSVVVLAAAAVMWAHYTIAALAQGAYGLSGLNALLLIGTVWTITRVLRRRRRHVR